tara:strand:+ start:2133 stop:2402 length:270 start_codon:yes stop_codon:yes gene_type:complete
MEKFVVWGKYCNDAISKREEFRDEHLKRLNKLKEQNILITLGPTKCTTYLFGIFRAKDKSYVKDLLENDIYWKKGIWISLEIYQWVQAF